MTALLPSLERPLRPSRMRSPAAPTLGLVELLSRLARRPLALFAWLVLLNAIGLPYLGYVHDARLYSGQVLNALHPEVLGEDLFFRFGSQDRFSAFSRLMAPLVAGLGLDAAFFLVSLASI